MRKANKIVFPVVYFFLILLSLQSAYSINIDSCNPTWKNDSNVDYDIINNINYDASTFCLRFRNAENITLNCNGYWLNGTNDDSLDYSIYTENVKNITVKDCKLNNWTFGVYYYRTNNSFLENISSYNINKTIKLKESNNNLAWNLKLFYAKEDRKSVV